MNENELRGEARYLGGKIQKEAGDAVDSTDWQVDGVVKQVSGAAEHAYGRARAVAEDVLEGAPALADGARERLHDVAGQAQDAVRRGSATLNDSVRSDPAILAVAAGVIGLAVGWLIRGNRV
ncbi:CsbD family protein [Novosphingobium fluoreni]|uniref:CsbD family protein n=1 Tax=Novosphingobium fluoreni TaxID=1391222 RepID=UPI003DA0692E